MRSRMTRAPGRSVSQTPNVHPNTRYWYLVSTRRKYGLRYPCGARKHVGMAPVVVSIASWAAPTSHAVRVGLASARRLCVWVWLPISKPERATSRPSSGYRSTWRPTMKKVAGTRSRWRR